MGSPSLRVGGWGGGGGGGGGVDGGYGEAVEVGGIYRWGMTETEVGKRWERSGSKGERGGWWCVCAAGGSSGGCQTGGERVSGEGRVAVRNVAG